MSTQPQTEEYLAARRESCRLLGLNADDLTPHEMIRADLATVLRLWLDGSQSALLAGGNADPVKLLSVVEALTKLVPETEHKSRGEDPRAYMWRTYSEMRRRGADVGQGYDGLKLENERLKARVAELEAGGPVPEEPSAPAPHAPAPGGNVVPLTAGSRPEAKSKEATGAATPPKPTPPQPAVHGDLVMVVDASPAEPWREYVEPDGSIRATPFGGGKYWGPV
jgi:hypothetical protein